MKRRVTIAAKVAPAPPAPPPFPTAVGGAPFFLSRITVICCASQHDLSHGLGLSVVRKKDHRESVSRSIIDWFVREQCSKSTQVRSCGDLRLRKCVRRVGGRAGRGETARARPRNKSATFFTPLSTVLFGYCDNGLIR